MSDAKPQFWHWPDHCIGKREARRLREEHNAAMNERAELLTACQQAEHWLAEELAKPGETTPEAILTALRSAIAKAEGAK